MSRRETLVSYGEWALATGMTTLLLFVHGQNLLRAPMLWRDEISTHFIATQPSLGEVWSLMEWESSPLLWPLTLRLWSALGLGGSAISLRALSLLVGVAVLASLFIALRRIAGTLPLLSLLLVAANPSVIRYGDTLRAYGLGLLLAILLTVALWELAQRVSRGRIIVAAVLATLAVQCLYHDAVVVLALCSGCSAAWAVRRRFREAAVPLAIGGLAALSLLPYLGPLGRAREWNVVFRAPVDAAWLVGKLRQTVEIDGPWLSVVWVGLAIAALGACAYRLWRPAATPESLAERRAHTVFLTVSLVVSVVGYATFLILVGYPTQSWYYLSLLGLAAVLIESSLQIHTSGGLGWRAIRLGIVAAGFAFAAKGIWAVSPTRLTNLDRVAAALVEQARPDDLILVAPWYLGISFDHYYAGVTPWLTVPDLSDHELTRYDLVKDLMTRPAAVRPISDRVQATLERRGRVWLVGELPLEAGNPPPPATPIAPNSPLGWSESEYQYLWSRAVAHRLQEYADRRARVPIEDLGVVSPFENPPLYRFEALP